jgi:hypothetical protein
MSKTSNKTRSTVAATLVDALVVAETATPIEIVEVAPIEVVTVEVDKVAQLRALLTDETIDVTAVLTELGLVTTKSTKSKEASKQQLANALLEVEYAKPVVPQRKDLIALLMTNCNMGQAYAGTALQNFKEKRGLVNHKF